MTDWLIFLGRPTVSPWPGTILDIARACERNNAASGVNGLLIFGHDVYLEYLEGSAASLDETWERIRADDRHVVAWSLRGQSPAPMIRDLPLGYFDADRERSSVQSTPIWRARHDWQEGQAKELIGMIEVILGEKYPSARA